MNVSSPLPVEMVTQPAQLRDAIQVVCHEPVIALDTESNSLHHYPEQLCLIQIATSHKVYLIDTIALKELAPLKGVLANKAIVKVVHGADYDVRSLDRHYGFRVRNLYDTNIAARFDGMSKVGLAALIGELLGVTILKNRRLQRADWGSRPLSAEALDYAAADVRYLLVVREILNQRLHALKREAWVAEECARLEEVRYTAPNLETAFLSVKGARDLDGRGLAILQGLFMFREEEARCHHQPPFFVLPDSALIFLAAHPTTDLSQVPGLGQVALQRFRQALQQALRDGLAAPAIHRSPPVRRTPQAEGVRRDQVDERLRRLKVWRASQGARLSLDPALLWPTANLENLARAPATLDEELASPDIRRWQHDQFASSLRAYLESLR